MTKAKKQEKTIEQRLEEALVLYEKTPYELPSNWCWVNFTAIIDIKGGNQPPKSEFVEDLRDGYIRFIQIRDYTSDKFKTYIPLKKNLTIVDEEDILIARYGASLGKICRGIAGACNVALAKTIFNKNYLCPDYLFYLLKTEVFQTPLSLLSRTAQAGFNKNDLEHFKFPLAPLEEQKRIVEIIEKQFTKLDEARDLIQKSLDSFADRKSAILHKAFTGELTKQWREGKGVYRTTNEMSLGDYLFPMETKKPNKEEEYFDYIDIDSIDNKQQRVVEPKKILVKEAPSRAARELKEDDIVFSMVRPYLRNIAYITKNLAHCIASTGFYVCRCKNGLNPHYLFYYLCNQELLDYLTEHFMRGDNSPSIRKDDLLGLKLVIPSTEEQEEIVRILDSIFEKEDKSKELIDMLDKIDEMKKSILARAFRGELGTSNPTDEPATDLLRKILENN